MQEKEKTGHTMKKRKGVCVKNTIFHAGFVTFFISR